VEEKAAARMMPITSDSTIPTGSSSGAELVAQYMKVCFTSPWLQMACEVYLDEARMTAPFPLPAHHLQFLVMLMHLQPQWLPQTITDAHVAALVCSFSNASERDVYPWARRSTDRRISRRICG
jgi:hypothetical protein